MNHAMLDIMYFQYNDLLFAALNIASFLNYDKQEAIYFFTVKIQYIHILDNFVSVPLFLMIQLYQKNSLVVPK